MRQLQAKENTDIVLVVDKKALNCHGQVLRLYSELFTNCLPTGAVITLPTKRLKDSTVHLLYEWMLSGGVDCPRSELLNLLHAAHYFYIPKLVDTVYQCLNDKRCFSALDAIHAYFVARRENWPAIADLMVSYTCQFFLLLVCTDEYKEMDLKYVCSILRCDKLYVQSEIEVFYGALFWLFADYEARQRYLPQLLGCVRFSLFPPRFLLVLAKHLHELPLKIADELWPRLAQTMLHQQEVHMGLFDHEDVVKCGRIWISDPECSYIERVGTHGITHVEFLDYVEKLNCAQSFMKRLQQV
ncbi:hypothetical protein KR222_010080 [Zaprionus bogoriensis]|nr:hypothetical protein KR222_010080 [Zaprionus bogoriensis]